MKGPRKIHQGQELAGIPASGWNAFVDTHHLVSQMREKPKGAARATSAPEHLSPVAINDAGETLTSRFPIVRLTTPAIAPADTTDTAGVALRGVQFKCAKPDEDSLLTFAVLQGPCKNGEPAAAAIVGLTWCIINVTDADHEFATAVDGDAAKLVSAASGVPIKWKPSGTGDKLCIVLLGGGEKYVTIKGTTSAVTRSDPTFTLTDPESVNGPVPSGTITVTNDPPINTPGGRTVYARYNVSVGDDDLTHWDTGDGGNWLLHDRGLADFVAGEDQVHDHDAAGDPHWHGAGPCEPE